MNDNLQESSINTKHDTATNESWHIQDVLSGIESTSSKDDGIKIATKATADGNGGR